MNNPENQQNSTIPIAQTPAPEKEEPKEPAQIDYEEGVTALDSKDFVQAAVSFHNAMKGFEENGNREGMANAMNRLGDVCLHNNDLEKAASHYLKCLEICREFDDLMSIIALKKKIATCYRNGKKYQDAIDIYFDLLGHYEQMNNPQSAVAMLLTLADTFLESGVPAKAADAYRTAASIHANFGHKRQAQQLEEKAVELEGVRLDN